MDGDWGPVLRSLTIQTAVGPYEVVLGRGVLATLRGRLKKIGAGPANCYVVTSPAIWSLWGEALGRALGGSPGLLPPVLFVPPGEPHKRLSTVERLAAELLRAGAKRDSTVIAFGGGVIGDVAGFLAAVYMRGIPYVQIPTSLLAQVDSSVGGKTGVNLSAGKNLIGSFHPPKLVVADLDLLGTLPEREFRAGLFESIKCGVIQDADLFRFLERHRDRILARDADALGKVVLASIAVKAKLVMADERERGVRRLLNFGHTIGHATEAVTKYRVLLHGEAIGWGMIAAAEIAVRAGRISGEETERIRSLVLGYGPLPTLSLRAEALLRAASADKKHSGGVERFVLPERVGSAVVVEDVTREQQIGGVRAMLLLASKAVDVPKKRVHLGRNLGGHLQTHLRGQKP